jgi:hypothetical protein
VGSGQWTPDTCHRRVDSGQWTPDTFQWAVDTGELTVDSGQWADDTGQGTAFRTRAVLNITCSITRLTEQKEWKCVVFEQAF